MKASLFVAAVAAIVCGPMLGPNAAHAQTRTWVSGVGNDANPCALTAPCKTFAGAISKTVAGGEINCLDSGGFGTVTITKSITIDCQGAIGSILASGTNGVNINDSATATPGTIKVILRNLTINGAGNTPTPGLIGISYTSGAQVHLDNVRIFGFRGGSARGISMTSSGAGGNSLFINDSIVEDNVTGVFIDPAGGAANVVATRVQIYKNTGDGLTAAGSGAGAVFAAVFDSVSSLNGGHGFKAQGGGATVVLDVQRSASNNNGAGGFTADGLGAAVFIGNSMATNNGTGFNQLNSGQIRSYVNNAVDNNSNNGSATAPALNPM